jgi:hypothetical protein
MGGVEVKLNAVLTLALDEYEWSASCFSPYLTGLEGPTAVLDLVVKKRILLLPGIRPL